MDVRTVVNGQPAPRAGHILSGTVSTQQPAPASFTDPLYVVLDQSMIPVVFTAWPRSHGDTLPVAGDLVVVGFTQDDVPHVFGWGI
jgi:hypothetical protein